MTWDRGIDDPITDRETTPDEDRRRRWLAVALAGAVVAVVAVVFFGGGGSRPEEPGAQVPVPTARVRGPGTRVWIELTPVDGSAREGFPPPMIARGELICFGFGRVDFGERARPTLARCVETLDVPLLDPDEVASLVVVQAGFDTWHLLMTGTDDGGVRVVDGSGEELDPGRIHVDGDLIALRLPQGQVLSELSWISGRVRVTCTPAPDAVATGEFCADTP